MTFDDGEEDDNEDDGASSGDACKSTFDFRPSSIVFTTIIAIGLHVKELDSLQINAGRLLRICGRLSPTQLCKIKTRVKDGDLE